MVSSAPRSRHARVASALAGLVMLVGLLPAGVAAAPPSGSPTLLSPTEGQTVSSNPTFSWTAVGGAVKYRVQVSTSPSFSPFAYNVDTVNRKATPPADLPLGLLYWRVAATDGGAGVGSFTSGTFTKQWGAAPTITSPDLRRHLQLPDRASAVPLAAARRRQVVHARDRRRRRLHRRDVVHDEQHELHADRAADDRPDLLLAAPGHVLDRRRRHATGAQTRQYTYTWSTVPTLLTPANSVGIEVQDIVFSWNPVVGAKTYELQVSPNGDWANNLALDVIGQEHEVLAADDARQRRLLLARPGQGRQEPAEQRRLVPGVAVHPCVVRPAGAARAGLDRRRSARDDRRPDVQLDAGPPRLVLRDRVQRGHQLLAGRPDYRQLLHEPHDVDAVQRHRAAAGAGRLHARARSRTS